MPFEIVRHIALLLAFVNGSLRFTHEIRDCSSGDRLKSAAWRCIAVRILVTIMAMGTPAHYLCELILEMHLVA